jgi:hypothetical protein
MFQGTDSLFPQRDGVLSQRLKEARGEFYVGRPEAQLIWVVWDVRSQFAENWTLKNVNVGTEVFR